MRTTWPLGERKARVGQALAWYWQSPAPVRVGSAPTCTVHLPGGSTTIALSAASAEAEITACGDDLKTLQLALGWEPGALGEHGAAWILADGSDAFSVRVVDARTVATVDQVTLAEPLPRELSLENNPVLIPALWIGSLAAQAQPARNLLVETVYEPERAQGVSDGERTETGVLHIVRAPFDLALTSDQLARHLRGLGMVVEGSQGYEAALEQAEEMVILGLRANLVGAGLTEDDVTSPASVRQAALYYAATVLHSVIDPERATGLRSEADRLLDLALRSISMDANRDGVPDEERQVTGGRVSWGTQGGVPNRPTARFPLRSW